MPVAAGLGGGSSDAAAAIDAALAAWAAALDPEETGALAASLGSDVPFFLAGGAALVTGRGEFVEPLPDIQGEPPAVLLVTPRLPLATAAVFQAYAGGARPPDAARAREISERLATQMRAGLTGADLLRRAEELAAANDLRPAAVSIVPGLADFVGGAGEAGRVDPCASPAPGRRCGRSIQLWQRLARQFGWFDLAAVNGTLPLVGTGEPFVAATTIAGRHAAACGSSPRTAQRVRSGLARSTMDSTHAAGTIAASRPAEPGDTKGDEPR